MKRNSLIELYRFLFALVVLYYHYCFPVIKHLRIYSGRFAVCFFFLISGFFLKGRMMEFLKENEENTNWFGQYLVTRLKRFGWPLAIAYAVSIADTIVSGAWKTGFFHFLWFVHVMFIFELIALLLFKYVKKTQNLDWIFLGMIVLAIVIHEIPGMAMDEPICFIYMPLGYFLSKVRFRFKSIPLCLILIVVSTIGIGALMFTEYFWWKEYLMCVVVMPVLILALLSVRCTGVKVFNYLGYLSLEIYVYQCIARFSANFGVDSGTERFCIVATAVLLTELVRILGNRNSRFKPV